MEAYAVEGVRLAGDGALRDPDLAMHNYLAAGFTVRVAGKKRATKLLTVTEAKRLAETLTKDQEKDLEQIVTMASDLHSLGPVVRDHVNAVRMAASVGGQDTLFVCPGSSPDKVGLCLEYLGYHTISIPFSRDFWRGRKGDLDNVTAKLRRDFGKEVAKPLREAYDVSGKSRIVIVDFVETGNTFLAWLEMLKQVDPGLYEVTEIVALGEKEWVTDEIGLLLSNMRARVTLVPVEHTFWKFPKLMRCVRKLTSAGPQGLPPFVIAICNAARVFVALRVFPRLSAVKTRIRKKASSSSANGTKNSLQ